MATVVLNGQTNYSCASIKCIRKNYKQYNIVYINMYVASWVLTHPVFRLVFKKCIYLRKENKLRLIQKWAWLTVGFGDVLLKPSFY